MTDSTSGPTPRTFWGWVWILALGSSACGALGATAAAVTGQVTAPWLVAVYAWLILVWMVIAAYRSEDS